GTVGHDPFLDAFEKTPVRSVRVVRRLQQEWRNCGHEDRVANAFGSVAAQVAGHLAATHRKPHQGYITKVELRHEFVQVLREGIVLVARHRLAGVSKSSAVIGDYAITRSNQNGYLFFPGAATERPAVNQDY